MHQGAVVGVIKGVCGGGLKVCIRVRLLCVIVVAMEGCEYEPGCDLLCALVVAMEGCVYESGCGL